MEEQTINDILEEIAVSIENARAEIAPKISSINQHLMLKNTMPETAPFAGLVIGMPSGLTTWANSVRLLKEAELAPEIGGV